MATRKKPRRKSPVQRGLSRTQIRGMITGGSKKSPLRRRRRKSLSDGVVSQAKPAVMAAAGGVAAGFIASKLKLSPNPKTNSLIHVGVGILGGMFAASKGQAAVGFGFAGAMVALNIGNVVPGLA